MIFSPFKKSDFVMPCEQCGKRGEVTFALPTVNKIDGNDFEIVPLWHCGSCNVLFDGLPNTVTNNPAIVKHFRFTPSGASQLSKNQEVGMLDKMGKYVKDLLATNAMKSQAASVDIKSSTDDQIDRLRKNVVNFKLK